MDSRLRRSAILSSLGVIVLFVSLVIYLNQEQGNKVSKERAQTGQAKESAGDVQMDREAAQAADGQIGDDLSGFMRDATFFDEETDAVKTMDTQNAIRVSMIITSVERDLRIQVVDAYGNPITGEGFFVSLDGKGEYKDLDRDGLLYISDLEAGDYQVSLLPIAGYVVPTSPTRVRVKASVEYLAIEDISVLIKTEEEIDAMAEDTSIQKADVDADQTEIKRVQTDRGKGGLGIDVSKWNGAIDWDQVRNAGVKFAIIRAGYRGSKTGVIVEDPYYRDNLRGALAAGIDTGIYFFTQATTEVEAVEEASAVLALLDGQTLAYPIYIDTESAGGNGRADNLDVETRTRVCEAFCRTIENAGYRAGVYASRNWYHNAVQVQRLEQYEIWLAEYRSKPLYQRYYQIWQYTSKGKIDGIAGNVDLNLRME